MITYVFTQLILVCVSLSFSTLTEYHYANISAQIALLFYNLFPYVRIKYLAGGLLGSAVLSSGLAWIISAVRTWRYFYFPTKEGASLFVECATNTIVVLVQLVLMVTQGKDLVKNAKVKYVDKLFTICVYILFFHDFVYAGLFTYSEDMTRLFGYTQFIVHTLMLGLNKLNFEIFQYIWIALIVQHVYVLWSYEDVMIRMFTMVYVVADLIYLVNSALQHQTSIVTRSIKRILGPTESRVE